MRKPKTAPFLLLLVFGLTTAAAQETAEPQNPAALEEAEAASGLTTSEDLEAFVDGVMAAHMATRDIPAATVSVVRDGELFFAKGYGWADREKRIPVDPEKTLFRPGSVSKLFTWTAVMQLVERGKLDLDADVNDYLETFQIPDTFPEPVTLAHLLTHRPGFEDGALGYLFIKSADEIVPLAESLAAHVPERVRPPGTYPSYSNYGAALAGLVVANVSGMPFAEYVEKNIFEPLGMDRSTFREPLPERLAPDMAVGYKREGGRYVAGDFELISNFAPAGSMSSTATDMARFMIAHLAHGRYGDARILEEETAGRMHSRIYTLDPRLPGVAHGFYEMSIGDLRIIGHAGDTLFFHSQLALIPEHGVGLFVSYVTNGGEARNQLLEAFVERYFPEPKPPLAPPGDFQERGERFAGSYRFIRHNYSRLEKALALQSSIDVAVTEEKTLVMTGFSEEPLHWVEVEPLFFRQVDGFGTLAFEEDENGEITHLFLGLIPVIPANRLAWYETQGFNFAILGFGALACLTTLIGAFRNRRKDRAAPSGARWAQRLAAVVGGLTLVFFVTVGAVLSSMGIEIYYGVPPVLGAALVLPIVTSVLTVGVLICLVLAWKRGFWTVGRRVHYTIFSFLAVGLVWFYAYWNVLGFRY